MHGRVWSARRLGWQERIVCDISTKSTIRICGLEIVCRMEFILVDSCAYWGHNESDLGSWRAPRYRMGKSFFDEYRKRMDVFDSRKDLNYRNALYATQTRWIEPWELESTKIQDGKMVLGWVSETHGRVWSARGLGCQKRIVCDVSTKLTIPFICSMRPTC